MSIALALLCFGEKTLAQETDTLRADDRSPYFIFRYPDVYGDDYRNMFFVMPETSKITGVLFAFGTVNGERWTTGSPELVTMLWSAGVDSLPNEDEVLLRDTLAFEEYGSQVYDLGTTWTEDSSQFVRVDLSDHDLWLNAFESFNVGYTALLDSPGDSLAILADDGSLTRLASEYYNGEFVWLEEAWSNVNLMIRVLLEVPQTGEEILLPVTSALLHGYPNPFNPETTLSVSLAKPEEIDLRVYDLLGREVAQVAEGRLNAGAHEFRVDGSSWASGSYFARLMSGEQVTTLKLILER